MDAKTIMTNHEAGETGTCCTLPASFPSVGHMDHCTPKLPPLSSSPIAASPMGTGRVSVAQQFEPTSAQPIRQHARLAGDPVHSVPGGGEQWGNHGKVYRGRGAAAKAAAQGRAAYANGYKGK